MNFLLLKSPSPRDQTQSRLMLLAAGFVFLFAAILTLSPAARLHSWQAPYRWAQWIGFAVWLVGFGFLHQQTGRLLPDRDPYLLPLAAMLTGWGLLTIYRLDTVLGLRQTAWLAVCLLVFWFGIRRPGILSLLRRYKYLELTGGLLLTALTFIFGTYPGGIGPRLWLGCCGIYFQPSEPLKLLLIAYLAAYLADRLAVSLSLTELLAPSLVLTGAALAILIAQRDLGTATLFIFLYSLVVFLASGKRRILIASSAVILAAGLVGYQLFDVIRIRVDAWANPWIDPSGHSFQIVQSLVSIASGGLFGAGPGMGSPGLVPVAHSDFIFTAIAEENGLLGAVGLLALIGLLAGRGLRIALRAPNSYQRYLSAGLTAYLCGQGMLIIAGNLRLLPLTGVTLPFVSYGGSSLLTSFISILVLAWISNTAEREPAPLAVPRPYLYTGAGLLAALAVIALANGWWSFVRADNLIARADNPRPFINDRYVSRGALLDRSNRQIDITTGQPGSYTRNYLYAPLSATAGYSDPIYGQAGLEASQDAYLRGLQGTPSLTVLLDHLLYNQTPPGLNVRTSLDLDLQALADRALGDHKGALVLLDARTGDLLVMASHPYADPAQIEQNWSGWLKDKNAPLLNRVTQGQYSPGTAIGPFLLALASAQSDLPPLPSSLSYTSNSRTWNCAQPAPPKPTWEWAVSNGCPAALIALGNQIGSAQLTAMFHLIGLDQTPDVPLPGAVSSTPREIQNPELAALGEEGLQVTPLQMALAASTLTVDGTLPAARLVSAVQTPSQGWVILPSGASQPGIPAAAATTAARMLTAQTTPFWQVVGSGQTAQGRVTWYLGGTLPGQQGSPLALAIALEEDNPTLAQQIGQSILTAAQH